MLVRRRLTAVNVFLNMRVLAASGVIECRQPLGVLDQKMGLQHVTPSGKASHTTFERLSFNGSTSVVKCERSSDITRPCFCSKRNLLSHTPT